jgi:hypothetical protein
VDYKFDWSRSVASDFHPGLFDPPCLVPGEALHGLPAAGLVFEIEIGQC